MNEFDMTGIHPVNEQRFITNCTPMAAHDCVITPCNRITQSYLNLARRYALPCAPTDAPFTMFNWGN